MDDKQAEILEGALIRLAHQHDFQLFLEYFKYLQKSEMDLVSSDNIVTNTNLHVYHSGRLSVVNEIINYIETLK